MHFVSFNLIYWTPICGRHLLEDSDLEKYGKMWKNSRFSGRIWPDWGNTTWADLAGLGSIGLMRPFSDQRTSSGRPYDEQPTSRGHPQDQFTDHHLTISDVLRTSVCFLLPQAVLHVLINTYINMTILGMRVVLAITARIAVNFGTALWRERTKLYTQQQIQLLGSWGQYASGRFEAAWCKPVCMYLKMWTK